MKNSFVLYTEYAKHLTLLSMEQRGLLFTAIMAYETGDAMPEMDGMTQMAFSFISDQLSRDKEKYESICKKRSAAGQNGGRPKASASEEKQELFEESKKSKCFSEKANESKRKQKNPDNEDEDEDEDFVKWEDLPKAVKKAFKEQYSFDLNKPQAMNGFSDLGVYLLLGSDDVSNVPQIGLGESLLSNILTYLYEYDFYNTCFNTDMYLARGRVLVPKFMQSPMAKTGAQNAGLDDFLYTKWETPNTDNQKPEAIQFALRAAEWKEARNMLLECIATTIGMSVSTLASYLNDGSNRTAREVSAEENATTLFVENARRRFETPLNALLSDVLRFYGYVDDIEVRWSRSGMTNVTVLVDTLTKAVDSGLISRKKAHHSFNYDDDEEQNEEDYKLVEAERQQNEYSEQDYMRDLYADSEQAAQPAGDSAGRSGDEDTDDRQRGVPQKNAEEGDR